MAKPTHINSPQELSNILSSSRIVVIDFWAAWCGPCRMIEPIYEQLSARLSRPNVITFAKVNVDEQKPIAQQYGITAMPTFMIFKSGRETKRIQGANVKELDAAIKALAQEAATAGESGDVSGSGSGKNWLGAVVPKGYEDVTEQVDQRGLDFLNVDGQTGSAKVIFKTEIPSGLNSKDKASETDWIDSDTDEQLMLFIPFQSTMKLHTLHITSIPPAGDDEITRPRTLHLYTNRTTVLGFDEAEDMTSVQTIELQENDYDKKTGTAKIELRFVKFQNISSLVIFIADGLGDGEKTRVDRIRLLGEAGEKKTMGKLEKIGNEQGE